MWMVNPETNTQAWRGSWQASQSDQRFAKASCFSRVQAGCTTRFAASQTAPSIKGRVDCESEFVSVFGLFCSGFRSCRITPLDRKHGRIPAWLR